MLMSTFTKKLKNTNKDEYLPTLALDNSISSIFGITPYSLYGYDIVTLTNFATVKKVSFTWTFSIASVLHNELGDLKYTGNTGHG